MNEVELRSGEYMLSNEIGDLSPAPLRIELDEDERIVAVETVVGRGPLSARVWIARYPNESARDT